MDKEMPDTDEELRAPFDADVLLSEYGPGNLEAFGRDFMETLLEDLGRILKENAFLLKTSTRLKSVSPPLGF